jgi:hypothetical protein
MAINVPKLDNSATCLVYGWENVSERLEELLSTFALFSPPPPKKKRKENEAFATLTRSKVIGWGVRPP